MKIIAFRLCEGDYLGYKLLDDKAEILIQFFLSDVGPYGESFIEFINDVDYHQTTRNYTCVAKEGNDVLIGCQFDDYPYEDCFRISQKEFLSMLDQWRKLVKQKPQEIIVYKEGESYRLEGRGFPDKPA